MISQLLFASESQRLLKLSEWINRLLSPGHRRVCPYRHGLFFDKRNFCPLGKAHLRVPFASSYCPLSDVGVHLTSGDPTAGSLPADFHPKCLLRILVNISREPFVPVPGDGRRS